MDDDRFESIVRHGVLWLVSAHSYAITCSTPSPSHMQYTLTCSHSSHREMCLRTEPEMFKKAIDPKDPIYTLIPALSREPLEDGDVSK